MFGVVFIDQIGIDFANRFRAITLVGPIFWPKIYTLELAMKILTHQQKKYRYFPKTTFWVQGGQKRIFPTQTKITFLRSQNFLFSFL